MDAKNLISREMIRDCLARLARGEDRRDAGAIRQCYWPDAMLEFGIFAGNFEEYLAWVVPGSPAVTVTLHTLGQSLIDLQGDKAAAETHVSAYHRINTGPEERDLTIAGRYLDRIEKRGTEWRIAHRAFIYDWVQDFGQSADWSKGIMGSPFCSGQPTGRAQGDPSVDFFREFAARAGS